MFVWIWSRRKPYKPHKPHKPHKPGKKLNLLSILLIIAGVLLVMLYTPPWVWCFILGLGLIAAGILSLSKWR